MLKIENLLMFSFSLHSTFQPSRDDFKKPSFADKSFQEVVDACTQLERFEERFIA